MTRPPRCPYSGQHHYTCAPATVRCVDCGGLFCPSHVAYRVGAPQARCPECSAQDLLRPKETDTVSPRRTKPAETAETPESDSATAVAEPAPPTSRERFVKQHLRCTLSDLERLDRADKMAEAFHDLEREEHRQESLKAQMKSRMAELRERHKQLVEVVGSGEEYRDVVVRVTYDYSDGTVTEVRTDTGDQIDIRQMTDHERQMYLPGAELPTADEDALDDDQDTGEEN